MSDDVPSEIYVSNTDYVRIDVKETTADRMSGWLKEYAEYCEVAGATKTAEHAITVAKRLEVEVQKDD